MQAFLAAKQAEIAEICRTHHVRRLEVFGSAVREDFDPERSDVDLLVEFERPGPQNRFEAYFDLHADLERALGRYVDLVEAGAIRNKYIRQTIEGEEQPVYAA